MKNSFDLTIDRLNIQLPDGFAHRADLIVREVAQQLSQLPMTTSQNIESLETPVIHVSGGESNRMLATTIAKGIHRQILSSQGMRAGHAD